jgi:hypothetical protein
MNDRAHSNQIERILDVMTLVPPYGWALLLAEVEQKIGTDVLQRIVERVYHQTERRKVEDLKRAVAAIKRAEPERIPAPPRQQPVKRTTNWKAE